MTNAYEERVLGSADGQRIAAEALLSGAQAYFVERQQLIGPLVGLDTP